MSLRAHTVGHPSMTGDPIPDFGTGRKGECGHQLSRYNPGPSCRGCAKKARLAALEPSGQEAPKYLSGELKKAILALVPNTAAIIGIELGVSTKRVSDVLRREWARGGLVRTGEKGHGTGPSSRGMSGGYYYDFPEGEQ